MTSRVFVTKHGCLLAFKRQRIQFACHSCRQCISLFAHNILLCDFALQSTSPLCGVSSLNTASFVQVICQREISHEFVAETRSVFFWSLLLYVPCTPFWDQPAYGNADLAGRHGIFLSRSRASFALPRLSFVHRFSTIRDSH